MFERGHVQSLISLFLLCIFWTGNVQDFARTQRVKFCLLTSAHTGHIN